MTCPRFSCRHLPTNICANKKSESEVELSSSGCQPGYFCPAERLYQDWWWYGFLSLNSTFPCLDLKRYNHIEVTDGEVYTKWPCDIRVEGKDLEVGSHPKSCVNEEDCRLQDGSLSACECSIKTTETSGVCRPHLSSSVFDDYWSYCPQGFIENSLLGFYFTTLQKYYVIKQSDVECAERVIWELHVLNTIHQELKEHSDMQFIAPMVVFLLI